jgi:hypothetical protein
MLLLLASFIVPVLLLDNTALAIPLLFMFYFGAYFIVIFFNTGLVHAVGNKLDGKEVSVLGSISFSFSRIVNIIEWALFSATVGLVLSIIRSQSRNKGIGGVVASIIASIIGVAWSFATFLVVPVMVFENIGPLSALKRSVELLKSTWSEQAWGGLGISGIVFLLYLPAIGAGILVYALGGFGALLLLLPALLIYIAMVFVIQGALEGIFTTEVYRYAATGKAAVFGDVLQQGRMSGPGPQAPPSQM